MFRKITIELDQNYAIYAIKEPNDIAIEIRKNNSIIVGNARLTTDNVDVSCITSMHIDDANVMLNDKFTLGEVFLKFLIKFPSVVRKPEFRFILDVPDNLKEQVAKYHFDKGEESNVKNEILIRKDKLLPEPRQNPEGIHFAEWLDDADLEKLLTLLKKNAYWQPHLTLARLKLLVHHSTCFVAYTNSNEMVGFARVVSNNRTFASLWDVVVDEKYRGRGIGFTIMFNIFSHPALKNIENWVLFTDSAKGLYQKFGFVSECDIPNRKLVHKLRLQEVQPTYMEPLIQAIADGRIFYLNAKQAFTYLFDKQGKRANLAKFWVEVSKDETLAISHLDSGAISLKVTKF